MVPLAFLIALTYFDSVCCFYRGFAYESTLSRSMYFIFLGCIVSGKQHFVFVLYFEIDGKMTILDLNLIIFT